MDGLRRRLINDYNSLTTKLNRSVKDKSFDPEIIINPDSIQREMDGIRNAIVTLAFLILRVSTALTLWVMMYILKLLCPKKVKNNLADLK